MRPSRRAPAAHPLHVLCACDAFKGTLPPDRVGEAVEAGYRQAWRTLKGRGAKAPSISAGRMSSHKLPTVAIPSHHSTPAGAAEAPCIAVEALAESLLPLSTHQNRQHLLYQDANQKEAGDATSGRATCAAQPAALLDGEIPVAFLHMPMSDGGAGLIDSVTFTSSREAQQGTPETTGDGACHTAATAAPAFHAAPALQLRRVYVPASTTITGPLGDPILHSEVASSAAAPSREQRVSFACDVARRVLVVEMAEAAGLPRIARPQDRHPAYTTSYGVGELVQYALRYMEGEIHKSETSAQGVAATNTKTGPAHTGVRLLLGIGGSATNDGGLGALQALGLQIFLRPLSSSASSGATEGVLLDQPFRGEHLGRVTHVRISDAMLRLFPCLQGSSPTPSPTSAAPAAGIDNTRLHIAEVCLICDVDNPLVGPRGATYIFGPQKCAPPPPPPPPLSSPPTTARDGAVADHTGVGDDAAVGAITSAQQKALLDALETGMRHAAACVVASTWRQLAPPAKGADAGQLAAAMASDDPLPRIEAEQSVVDAMLEDLLYSPGGGGAGGMSGFFRVVLRACYVPGADVVSGLLGLYETPRVAQLLGSYEVDSAGSTAVATASTANPEDLLTIDSSSVLHPRGRLFHNCDVFVSGEGSFDDQTVASHKTVGRLIEMCTAVNAYRLWKHYCHDTPSKDGARGVSPVAATARHPRQPGGGCRLIRELAVVCGRTSFDTYATCQAAVLQSVCSTLLRPPPDAAPAGTAAAEGATGTVGREGGCCLDTLRVALYLQELLKSSALFQDCGAHPPTGGASSPDKSEWCAAYILKRCCVPRVTVLPLTPTLFSIADAMQRPYACVMSAVACLLEDSARRLAGARRGGRRPKGISSL
ncbi:putative glycerate kinase [Leptomonas seymouri]|uniref:Putative glycerate kinase n=1 Tax=Leptomonas seymouri TaxID=5684 RepID=A0A0N0P4L9_LEPSE|nr:putative glycerate kinase [Leptomonas seymouri]|eukprot:KPI84977.1 putative glycerate kinase [Leptomonas seymouri]